MTTTTTTITQTDALARLYDAERQAARDVREIRREIAQLTDALREADENWRAVAITEQRAHEMTLDALAEAVQQVTGEDVAVVADPPAADVCEHGYAQGCRACDPDGAR